MVSVVATPFPAAEFSLDTWNLTRVPATFSLPRSLERFVRSEKSLI